MIISIALCTFNGEKYLLDQLQSIGSQTRKPDEMVVCDDASTDNTLDILNAFRKNSPFPVHIIRNDSNLGSINNFGKVLQLCKGDVIALSDQDDIWLPQKIQVTLDQMMALEERYGNDKPLLVHTDAKVVDSNLQEIAQSLWQYQKSNPAKGLTLGSLLLQNVATGCTVMLNRPLRDMALPISPDAMMHDWWLALVASSFGHTEHISEPTMLYRQHGRNDTGAKAWNARAAVRRLSDLEETIRNMKKVNIQLQCQAAAFIERYQDVLRDSDREIMAALSHLNEYNYFLRRYYMIKYGFFYTDFLRNIGWILLA